MCTVNRHFYKCPVCLCVAAVNATHAQNIECSHCSEFMEHMGRVEADRLIKVSERCACDERCTSARGPKCNCHCGGINHGTHAVVIVRIDCGKVIAETTPTAQQKREAREFLETREEARKEYRELSRRKNCGEYLGSEAFRRWLDLGRTLNKVNQYRTHAARMRALESVGYRPAPPKPVASPLEAPAAYLEPVLSVPSGRLF